MTWLKLSDTAPMHPKVLRLALTRGADERTVDEVFGFISRCAAISAGYLTDGIFDVTVATQVSGARWQTLTAQAVEGGLLRVKGRGPRRTWTVIPDNDLWHILSRADVEWARQRDADRRNPQLTNQVLARDGDQCRYCRVIVNWKDMRSGRGGTFDHTQPGQPATVDTYVVSCRRCNGILKDQPRPLDGIPLLPPPPMPYFSPASKTQEVLTTYFGHHIPSATDPIRPTAPGTAAATGAQPGRRRTAAATGAQPATPGRQQQPQARSSHAGQQQPQARSQHTHPPDQPPDQVDINLIEGWQPGTGREGTDQDGPGHAWTGQDRPGPDWTGSPPPQVPPDAQPRQRGSRGSRGRGEPT